MSEGTKHDQGKLDWSLLDFDLIEPLIHVLALGEERYTFEDPTIAVKTEPISFEAYIQYGTK